MPDLTIAEAAVELGLKESWVRDHVKARVIPFRKYDGLIRFTTEDIAEIRAMYKQEPRKPVSATALLRLIPQTSPDQPGPGKPRPPSKPAPLPRPTTPPKTDPPKKTRAAA